MTFRLSLAVAAAMFLAATAAADEPATDPNQPAVRERGFTGFILDTDATFQRNVLIGGSIYFDATLGRLGIGDTSPENDLDVQSDENRDVFATVTSSSTGGQARAIVQAVNGSGGTMSLIATGAGYTLVPEWANRGVIASSLATDGMTFNTLATDDIRFEAGGIGNPELTISADRVALTNARLELAAADTLIVDEGATVTATRSLVNISSSTPVTLEGNVAIADGTNGQLLTIVNVGEGTVTIPANANTRNPAGSAITLRTADSITYIWSTPLADWVCTHRSANSTPDVWQVQ